MRDTLRKPSAAQLRGLKLIDTAAAALADELSTEDAYRRAEARDIRSGLKWLRAALARVQGGA